MTRLVHDHQLDGHLHDEDGCPMCVEIRARMVRAKIDSSAYKALAEYAEQTRRLRRRDVEP